MLKKLNMLVLIMLIVSQTILGPMTSAGIVFAEEGNDDGNGQDATEETVDKSELEQALEDAEKYEEADYTEDSFKAFVEAVTDGEKVFKDEDAAEADVNDAVTAIEKAIDSLQKQTTPEDDEGDTEESTEPETPEGNDSEVVEEEKAEDAQTVKPFAATPAPLNSYVDEILLNDEDHLKGFLFTVNGKSFDEDTKISNGDSFELSIELNDLNSEVLNFGPGTVLKYPLPTGFSNHFTYSENLGSLSGYGDVKIVADHIEITLNDNVLDDHGIPHNIENGKFDIKGNLSNDNDDWEKDIAMPGGEKFTVNFKPKQGEGVTVQKNNGVPYKDDTQTDQKSNKIEWKVTVNTDLANTANNPVFKDTLSANATGHKYDKGSVKIYEIDVRPNGDTSNKKEINITPTFTNDDTEMTINLEAGKAYEITYTTIPDNPGTNEDVIYHNSANYDGNRDSGSTSVHFGKAIDKEVKQPGTDLITNWTIKYNGNEQLIESGTTMSDSWTTNLPQGSTQEAKQDLVGGADGISIAGFTKGTDYEVIYTDGNQGFEIKFLKDFSNPIEIKYQTKPVEGLKGSESFTVVNEANHGQIDTSAKETSRYNQTSLTLKKDATSRLDYNTKTMTWKITANQAGYDLAAGATFVDIFTNKNMVLDATAEFKVTIGGQPATEGASADYVLTDKGTDGFEVKLNNPTDKEVVIEYTTSFDQIKVDEDRSKNYHNRVVLTDSGLPGKPEDTANIDSIQEQKVNGSKSGTYNYVTKEFTWTIIFNYNSNTLTNAVLKDVLPEEHEITEATLEKGSINKGGTFVADADQAEVTQPDIIGKHEFSHSLGLIDQPYRLVYKTKMKDDVLPVDGEKDYSVKNKAELLDGDKPNAEWERTVTVNHSNKVLDQKNGRQVNGTETIAWDFLYNTAQSKLTNVKITDTFGLDDGTPNQLLDEDSLKVYKVTYTSGGQINKKGQELTKGTDYKVSFNTEDGATFVLEFEELDHGIYVEYESVFIGIKDSPISNELAVTYNDGEEQVGSSNVPNLNFTYGAFASTSAGEFVVIKTDEATGEPMEGVEFTLKRGTRTIISGETDKNGVLDFEMPFATGNYSLEEVTQDGYEPLNNFTFSLNSDGGPYKGKQIVNVTNIKTTDKDKMCPDFTITVKDVEGNEEANKSVKLVNEETGQVFEETTDGDGKIVKDREDLPAGNYKVYEVDDNDEIYINDIEVKYIGEDNTECNAEVRPEVTSISGTKTWKDGGLDNNDRPAITIQLLADGEETDKTVTLNGVNASDNDDNVWEYEFKNLREYNNAGTEKIEYTVKELAVDGYKSEQDGTDFVNIRTSDATIEIPVEKVWEGPKVETEPVTINLLADGEKEADLVLSEDNEWKGSFKNLAIYDAEGEEIEYTVEEVEVEGYNTKTTGDATDEFTVTNTQKTYAIGDYVWVDYNNDGIQNESEEASLEGVTVELYDADENFIEKTTTDENGLYIFDELVAGEYKVKFTLTEDQAKKYKFTKQGSGNAEDSDADVENGWTTVIELNDDNDYLTQDYDTQTVKATEGIDPTWDAGVIELTEVTVDKIWKDEKESDRPDSITVNLKQDNVVIATKEIKADDKGEWTHTFTDLTKYVEEGKEYEYTVSEFDVPGYEVSYDQENLVITNTRAEEKSITINKAWLDNDDATENRPESIEVELFRSVADGDKESVNTYTLEPDSEDNWTLKIDKLPAFNEDGKAYMYEIEEIEVDGYKSTVDGFDITNLRVGTTDVSGEKTWDHKGVKENLPETITVNLLQNSVEIDSQEVTEAADGTWTYEFTDLAEFDENGAAYTYTVKEDKVSEYNAEEVDYDITNTRKTYAIGDYTWIDRNKDGIQDENEEALPGVKVELIDENNEVIAETTTDEDGRYIFDELVSGKYQVKFTLTEEQEKKYKFTKQDGGDVTEDSDADTNGYTKQFTLDEDNKQLTKDYEDQDFKASEGIDPTWDAGVIELIDVTGTKTWDHKGAKDLPTSITVQLLANGEEVDTQPVTADEDWTYSFTGLDKYDENGEEITYEVDEVVVAEYNKSVKGNDLTNIRKTYAIGDYVWIDKNKDGIQDKDEEILEGVTVELYDKDGKKIAETTTDENGRYIFDELVSGDYKVKFTLTEEQVKKYKFTKQNAGKDSTVDSDADENGWTKDISLNEESKALTKNYEDQDFKASEGIDPTWDAGVIELVDVTGTKTWDHKGAKDLPTSITVQLLANGEEVDAQPVTADEDWTYSFTGLDKYDENGDEITYEVDEVVVSEYNKFVERNDLTNTRKTYAIGDYTWIDRNKDGIQDKDEEILEGVTVELYDKDGKKIAETTTDKNGKYIFDELVSGDYKVKFTLTEEQAKKYKFTKQNAGKDSTVDSDADEKGWTTDIALNEDNKQLTKDYKDQTFTASEGIDPTWDAGVIEKLVEEEKVDEEKPKEDPKEDPKTCEEIEITVKEDGKPSKNKKYTLTSTDGKTKVTITTDENGKAKVDRDKLPYGKYVVTDADGNEVGTIEVTDDCYIELNIDTTTAALGESEGKKGGLLPKTATSIFTAAFAGLLLLGVGLAIHFGRKRKVS